MTADTDRARALKARLVSSALVIFDCDGVLVDSEALSCRIDVELLRERGVSMTFEEMMGRFVGLSYETMVNQISSEHAVMLEGFESESVRRFVHAIETELVPVNGIPAALAHLQTTACVASSSPMTRIRRSLEVTELLDFFAERIFSAQMVAAGKPAPDLFLLAAQQCGVAPRRCLVVEDSPHGIAAARAAGMMSIGFTGGSHCTGEHWRMLADAGADMLAKGGVELQRILSQLLATPEQGTPYE